MKKRKKLGRKLLSFLLTLAMVVGLMPGMSLTVRAADEVKYLEGSWDETEGKCKFTEQSTNSYTEVTDSSTSWDNGTYVVKSDVTISNRITVNGTVKLILCDGATLTAPAGIMVKEPNTLNIYAQSEGTGALVVEIPESYEFYGYAAIGSFGSDESHEYYDSGTINIYGGKLKVTGGPNAAAIGGGNYTTFTSISIYGGTINATSGENAGAAIGTGDNGSSGGKTITIYGGTVNATGVGCAAGIGGGGDDYGAGTVIIYGGTVTAKAGAGMNNYIPAGIGAAAYRMVNENVIINGGTVTAIGGSANAGGIGKNYIDDNTVGLITLGANMKLSHSTDGVTYTDYESTEYSNRPQYMKAEKTSVKYPLWVGGTQVTSDNASNIDGYNKASYNAETKTLTLNGYNNNNSVYSWTNAGEESCSAAIYAEKDLIIELSGTNTVNNTGTGMEDYGIYALNALTIKGSGQLNTNGGFGIYAFNTLDINSGVINATSTAENGAGISIWKGLNVTDGTVTATGEFQGINSQENITINGGTVTATGGHDGIFVATSYTSTISMTVEGGTVDATGGTYGIQAGDLKIKNGSSVTAACNDSDYCYAIYGTGANATSAGYVNNEIAGTGWTNRAGTEGQTAIAANSQKDLTPYKKVQFPAAHEHDFTYTLSADGTTITATCSEEGCDLPTDGDKHVATLKIAATGGAYDGTTAYGVTITDENSIQGTTTVSYYKANDAGTGKTGEALSGAPINAGKYWAEITLGTDTNTATAHVVYDVDKADPTISTVPTASVITYGQKLSSSNLSDGAASVTGSFAWKDDTISPAVSDSQSTQYDVVFTPEDTNNYNTKECQVKLTINQKEIGLLWTNTNLTYNGQEQTPTATATGLVSDDEGKVNVTVTGGQTNARTEAYTATASGLTGGKADNYKLPDEKTTPFTISPKSIIGAVVTLDSTQLTYNGSEQSVSVTDVSLDGVSLTTDDYTVSGNTGTNKNNYTVTVTGTGNYKNAATADWKIVAKSMTVTAEPVSKTYDGNEYDITVNVTEPSSGTTVMYGTEAGIYNLDASPKFKDAGTHTVYFKVSGNDDYSDYEGSATVTISKKAVTANVSAEDKPYDGKTDATVTASVPTEALVSGDSIEITGIKGNFVDANVGAGKKVTVDSSAKSISGTGSDNYEVTIPAETTASISKSEPKVTVPAPKTLTYTGSAQELVIAGEAEGGTMHYAVTTENKAPTDEKLYTTSIPTETNAGIYYVWYKVVGDTNHNDTTPSKVEVNIKPADVKVTAPTAINSTYNGKEQALVNAGVTEDGKVFYRLGTDGTWTDTVPTAKNVGEYEVYYYVDGDTNHSDSGSAKEPLGSVKVTIAKKTVTVSGITAEGKEYDGNTGATISTENATLAGLVDGDTLTVAAKGTFSDANAGNGKKVNITDITLGGTSVDNYVLAEEGQQKEATANITPKAVTVTPDAGQSKVYGAADPAFKYTAEGIVGEEKLSGALERTAGDSVGEYAYTIGTLDSANANYNVSIAENAPKFEIKKAALTVTAEAKNITYGDEDVILTYKVDGLAKGDTADKVLTGALTREAGTDAGTYKITQGNLTSANYSITFVGADYVIAKAAQAAPTGTFTTSKATGSDTADGKISGFEATKVYQISSDDGATWTDVEAESTSIDVKAGAYQIRYTGDKNHEPGASVSVTVEKKADQSKPEGLEIENVSAENATDGSITGVTDNMEYSTDDGKTWKAVPANADKIEGLAVGEVLVRYAGSDDKNASAEVTLTIGVASKTEGVVEFKPEEGGTTVEEKAITGVDNESTKASVEDFAETQQEEGKDVKVALEITPQKEENVNKESVEETNKVVEEVFAGIDSEKVVTEYLAIDVAKYVDNVKETENISDTKTPLEIALRFDGKKTNPIVVRTHDGKAKAFGKLKARPAKKDYKDAMFYIDVENAILYIYSQYFSDFAIVYANEATYNVGFVSGTSENLSPLVVAEGGKVTLPTGLKNEGYAFDGWYQDEAYTTAWKDSNTVNEDITLYAKWNKSVTGVSVATTDVKFTKAGETSQIKTTVTPSDAANTKVTYKSSDTKVATVDEGGKITAVANGIATITVTTEDGAKTATVKVTVAIPDVPKQAEPAKTEPTKTVEPAKPVEETAKLTMNAGLKISQKGSKIIIEWGKVSQADGYNVYVTYCGKKFGKAVRTVNKNSTTSVTVKKINGKKINLKKNYKVYVAAYKMTDGKKEILAKTITGHVVGRKNTKYSNAKKITLSKSKYSVKVGKTVKIRAKTVLVEKGKKQLSNAHAAEFRYASSNRNIATVDKNGKVKGIAKGTCTIYVYARNGYAKTVKVTVK